ncbi:MAG: prepilin-type N-terminal cleavage/methylation domain-containing protein [Gammaproteobacteria bacterium]|jgi:general secretion pathway protein G|nr:prepilin-type N-terminal cleavage/methylation domain-containing protein [Gammaproteobacteria bacterium]
MLLPTEKHCKRIRGFSLIEMLMVVAIFATLLSIAVPAYRKYTDAKDVAMAKKEIVEISAAIDRYFASQGRFPDSLVDVSLQNKLDPWGNKYFYMNISDPAYSGKARKDGKLHPVNSDYDLFSSGKDGEYKAPFNNSKSRDDIVRANNGKFIGLAAEY